MQEPTISSGVSQEQQSQSQAQQQQQRPKEIFLARIPPKWRVVLGLSVIVLMVIFTFIRPLERDPDAPLTVTNLRQTLEMHHELDFQGVHMTISKTLLASKFSDDSKRAGTFTVRVEVQTRTIGSKPVGIDFANRVWLVTSDGQRVDPKLVSILPMQMPESPQSGFFDFPVSSQVDLRGLALRFDDGQVVDLK